ncbi:PD-(D/E)XK nuclease family protein [Patescibacteria group bacterium]|nr:PD-(D/E)XK nuclease family protein [Patescibacteria group bacterium]
MAWKKYLYDPKSKGQFKISRSKIELFVQCPRCFYLDLRKGVKRPSFPSFTLNLAVDTLLKKEFDIHRAKNTAHPLLHHYGLDYTPFAHSKMDEWRYNFTGVGFLHKLTNFWVYGAVDDIWKDDKDNLIIVDYKATSTDKPIDMNDRWKESYKRQMEIYQWLARNNVDLGKHIISNDGYFVYCNGKKDAEAFDGRLEFEIELIKYQGSADWIEGVVADAWKCLKSDDLPKSAEDCEHCNYRQQAGEQELWQGKTLFG